MFKLSNSSDASHTDNVTDTPTDQTKIEASSIQYNNMYYIPNMYAYNYMVNYHNNMMNMHSSNIPHTNINTYVHPSLNNQINHTNQSNHNNKLKKQPTFRSNSKNVKREENHDEAYDDDDRVDDKISLTGIIDSKVRSKEEIEKWVNSRKKNFPSRENILKKQQQVDKEDIDGKMKDSELSILEMKLRKKLKIMDYNPQEEKKIQRERKTLLNRINNNTIYRKYNMDSMPREGKQKTDEIPRDATKPMDTKKYNNNKINSPQDIIDHLTQRRQEDDSIIDAFIFDKHSSDRFKYQQHNLLNNILLDDIYKERSIILQTIRYIVNNNYLQ